MLKIEAKTLEEAYAKAATELSCSVAEVKLNVIQYPSSGFLGFFKKNAIVEVCKNSDKHEFLNKIQNSKVNISEVSRNKHFDKKQNKKIFEDSAKKNYEKKPDHSIEVSTQAIQDNHKSALSEDSSFIIKEISQSITRIFNESSFAINCVDVSLSTDSKTVAIKLDGEDSALLIGKEGYRYKAFSYLFYNWINMKYNLSVKLEISEFLKNQEEWIDKYLIPVVDRVKSQGRGQTKLLDGVLIKIALEKLRETFPEKYVGIKTGRDGGKYIVINDFSRKNQ